MNYRQVIRRYGQVVRQWIANPLSPVRIWVSPKQRGYGGMVDTPDLKSVDLYGRESSSLSTPINVLIYIKELILGFLTK